MSTCILAVGAALAWSLGLSDPIPPIGISSLTLATPAWDLATLIGLGVPLYLVTMASQNLPGFAVLRASGYHPPTQPALAVTVAAAVGHPPSSAPAPRPGGDLVRALHRLGRPPSIRPSAWITRPCSTPCAGDGGTVRRSSSDCPARSAGELADDGSAYLHCSPRWRARWQVLGSRCIGWPRRGTLAVIVLRRSPCSASVRPSGALFPAS